jgi:CRP/FNR family transcriptional regulator, cyclic AMP receptor protein
MWMVRADRSDHETPLVPTGLRSAAMEWAILADLTREEQDEVLNLCSRVQFSKGQYVCREGERGDRLFLLELGHALVEVVTSRGDVSTFGVLGPGDVFGEQALVTDTDVRVASVIAIEPIEVLTMTRRQFERLSVAHPAVNRFLLAIVAVRMQDVTAQLLEALYSSADQRILSRLLRLAGAFADLDEPSVRIPLNQDQIASLAGTTRPTANKVLRGFAVSGAIQLGRGSMIVHDVELLRHLSEDLTSDTRSS